jgi:hypothetical protein
MYIAICWFTHKLLNNEIKESKKVIEEEVVDDYSEV